MACFEFLSLMCEYLTCRSCSVCVLQLNRKYMQILSEYGIVTLPSPSLRIFLQVRLRLLILLKHSVRRQLLHKV